MAEISAISWTDATFNPWLRDERIAPKLDLVRQLMATNAERHAISHIESQFRKLGKWPDVVGVKIATLIVTAMTASKFVSEKDIVSPLLQLGGRSLASSLDAFTINIARRVFSSRGTLSRLFADFGARFQRVLLADSVAWTSQCGCAHFCAALL